MSQDHDEVSAPDAHLTNGYGPTALPRNSDHWPPFPLDNNRRGSVQNPPTGSGALIHDSQIDTAATGHNPSVQGWGSRPWHNPLPTSQLAALGAATDAPSTKAVAVGHGRNGHRTSDRPRSFAEESRRNGADDGDREHHQEGDASMFNSSSRLVRNPNEGSHSVYVNTMFDAHQTTGAQSQQDSSHPSSRHSNDSRSSPTNFREAIASFQSRHGTSQSVASNRSSNPLGPYVQPHSDLSGRLGQNGDVSSLSDQLRDLNTGSAGARNAQTHGNATNLSQGLMNPSYGMTYGSQAWNQMSQGHLEQVSNSQNFNTYHHPLGNALPNGHGADRTFSRNEGGINGGGLGANWHSSRPTSSYPSSSHRSSPAHRFSAPSSRQSIAQPPSDQVWGSVGLPGQDHQRILQSLGRQPVPAPAIGSQSAQQLPAYVDFQGNNVAQFFNGQDMNHVNSHSYLMSLHNAAGTYPLGPSAPGMMHPGQPAPAQAANSFDATGMRSDVLQHFRNTHNRATRKWTLGDIQKCVVEFSGDQHGSRFIQNQLETANTDEKERCFSELEPNSVQLTKDVFGNYVIQKFFEHGSQLQKTRLAQNMMGKLREMSRETYACRVVQKAFTHVLLAQQIEMVAELAPDIVDLSKHEQGNHVVQRMICEVPRAHLDFLYNICKGSTIEEFSLNAYACRVIQRLLERGTEDDIRVILKEIKRCAPKLIMDNMGNYVVQCVMQQVGGEDGHEMIEMVIPDCARLARHKFASNVVERCLEFGTPEQRETIRVSLLGPDPNDDTQVDSLLNDSYGNYVLGRLIKTLPAEAGLHIATQARAIIPQKPLSNTRQSKGLNAILQLYEKLSEEVKLQRESATPVLTMEQNSPQTNNSPSTNSNSSRDATRAEPKPSDTNGEIGPAVAET